MIKEVDGGVCAKVEESVEESKWVIVLLDWTKLAWIKEKVILKKWSFCVVTKEKKNYVSALGFRNVEWVASIWDAFIRGKIIN